MNQAESINNYNNVAQANQDRWAQNDFRPDDFRLLDVNKDNLLTVSEFKASKLSTELFKQIAGGDNKVDQNEWNFQLANLPDKNRWQSGAFTDTDFQKIDFQHDGVIDRNDWTRSGLSDKLFSQLSNNRGVIGSPEWNNFTSVRVANAPRWRQGQFNAGDFARLDYDRNGVINAAEWQRNGLSSKLFSQVAAGSQQITAADWNHFTTNVVPNRERWNSGQFTGTDFRTIDRDNDGVISKADWQRTGLGAKLFNQVAGGNQQISGDDWNFFVGNIAPNRERWSAGQFTSADLRTIDHDRDNAISAADWRRTGLSDKLFKQVAGGGQQITSSDWSYFVNTVIPNRVNWYGRRFTAADYQKLDFGRDGSISASDWQRTGLSAKLFNQISADGKTIAASDWNYYTSVSLPNQTRWAGLKYTAADFRLIDYNGNGAISSAEWGKNGLSKNLLDRLAGGDKLIDTSEWGYFTGVTLANLSRWQSGTFNADDFSKLDFNHDYLVSAGEWRRNGLNGSQYSRLAGADGSLDTADWSYLINTTLPNQARWNAGQFYAADFQKLDFGHDNVISLADWQKNGLSSRLFAQVAGGSQSIGPADWNKFINITLANQGRWQAKQFTAADFQRLDYNGDGAISQTDWKMSGLNAKLFNQISTGSGRINQADWNYYVNTTLPNQARWQAGDFTVADLQKLDFNWDGSVSAAEWSRNGLNANLYQEIFAVA